MELEVTNWFGETVKVVPHVELYMQDDFMGNLMPGIAIALDTADTREPYGVITVSFGEFIGLKNCAYIDTNNFPRAEKTIAKIATNTGFTKRSGFCEYPLYCFNEDFLKECGGEKYKRYSEEYDAYFKEEDEDDI